MTPYFAGLVHLGLIIGTSVLCAVMLSAGLVQISMAHRIKRGEFSVGVFVLALCGVSTMVLAIILFFYSVRLVPAW